VRIDVWSDVVCPWCYIGKRRLETAVAGFAYRAELEIRWRAFELDPHAPPERPGDPARRVAAKYGISVEQARRGHQRLTDLAAAEGLAYRLEDTRGGNTFDAHRLIKLGGERGLADAVEERLMAGYLCQGRPIGDPSTVAALAVEAGLGATEVEEVLAGGRFSAEVRADEEEAAERGITGVPFFLVDGRFGIPGAQEPDTILALLGRAWERRQERSA